MKALYYLIILSLCFFRATQVNANSYQDIYNQSWSLVNDKFYDSSMNHQNWLKWKNRYSGKLKSQDDLDMAINTMLYSLNDPYTRYLPKVNFSEETNAIHDDLTSLSTTPRYFKTRIPKSIKYIRIDSMMNKNLSKEMSDFITESEKDKKLKGYIIDLRDNGGGLVKNASEIAGMFMDDKTVVTAQTNSKNIYNKTKNGKLTDKPVVILIDSCTASSCEVFTGAMKDNKRATVVGTTSFGKGVIQQINKLDNGSGINITVMNYFTPNGTSINHNGITPDIEVWFTRKDIFLKRDVQLIKAIKILNK